MLAVMMIIFISEFCKNILIKDLFNGALHLHFCELLLLLLPSLLLFLPADMVFFMKIAKKKY